MSPSFCSMALVSGLLLRRRSLSVLWLPWQMLTPRIIIVFVVKVSFLVVLPLDFLIVVIILSSSSSSSVSSKEVTTKERSMIPLDGRLASGPLHHVLVQNSGKDASAVQRATTRYRYRPLSIHDGG